MSNPAEQARRIVESATDPSRPPLLMGILNVTPDSFYDGGRFADVDSAVSRGLELAEQGADIIDVGGESTRPGARTLDPAEEMDRVLPVVEELAARVDVPMSIDTRHAATAAAALDEGAIMVNDVSAFTFDPEMPALLGARKPLAVAMHMRGTPADMQTRTRYDSLCEDVASELWDAVRPALEAGLPKENLFLDPGIGFAKTWRQCLVLLNRLDVLGALGRPLLVGVSRKSFIGHVLGDRDTKDRLFGTAGAVACAVMRGARVLRVHDVAEMRDVAMLAHAIASADAECGPEVAA